MSIRIYALAKQLQVESKILVDLCKQIGLEGKGSALASLTDEEVEQVKQALPASSSARGAKGFTGGGAAPMLKPSLSLHSGKIPVLKPARTPRPEPKSESVSEPVKPTPPEKTTPMIEPAPEPDEVKAQSAPVIAEKGTATSAPKLSLGGGSLWERLGKERPSSADKSAAAPPKKAEIAKPEPEESRPAPTAAPESPPPSKRKSFDTPLASRRDEVRQKQTEAPPVSFEEAARLAAIEEMRQRPPVSRHSDDRIQNLDAPKKKKSDSDKRSDSEGGKPAPRSGKPPVAIHLAPMPTAPAKPSRKEAKPEQTQQPTARFKTPEELRAAMTRTQQKSPLSGMIEQVRERNKKGKSPIQDSRMPSAGGLPASDRVKREQDRDKSPRRKVEPFFTPEDTSSASKRPQSKKGKGRDAEGRDEGREKRPRVLDSKRYRDDMESDVSPRFSSRRGGIKRGKPAVSTAPRKGDIVIEMPCTLKQFAEATGLSGAVVIKKCIEFGHLLTINKPLDEELAELLVEAFELKAVIKKAKTLEEEYYDAALEEVDPQDTLKPRPPVVTFLGHVDHGKTSLLDRILHLNVVSGEKGGITQHIRAYRISTKSGDVTFVDTPGHEAFTAMRARGANCTDIAVLVVAADDGVMPQTEEAISHAKAAGVPIVVALNKMDLPGVHRDRVIQELAGNDIMPSEWGGDVEIVETSAVTGQGIDELLQTLLTIAELRELQANPDRHATGVVLESSMLPGQGVVCKALVQKGTLRPGDVVLCGNAYGRVKVMFDTLDESRHIAEAGPSTPVSMLGLDTAPGAGSKFVVLDDISAARQIAEERTKQYHESELADVETHVTLENLFERISGSKSQQVLNIIVRADVRGSIEAIRKELSKLEHPEVKLKILQASVGGVTEADVHLADASDAIIVGFNVVPDEGARTLAEKQKVQIRRYDIIYKLTEDIRAALEGMLKPMEQVKELGRVVVQRVFSISRVGNIAGCRVVSGIVERDGRVRIIRDSRVIGEYSIDTLKREKDDAREVRTNQECGIKLKNYNDIKEGDILEVFKIEEIARTF